MYANHSDKKSSIKNISRYPMNLHIIDHPIFRDRTRLRCTKDGRLLIKNAVAKKMNLGTTRHLGYLIHRLDETSGTLVLIFTKMPSGDTKPIIVNNISGTKILALGSVLSKYSSLTAQYVKFNVANQGELWVTFKISGQ
jgi:hypothetical protein